MNLRMMALTALGAISLAACDQSATTGPYPGALKPAATTAAGPVTPAGPVAPGGAAPALTPQFLAGTWSDDPTCATNQVTFTADGGFIEQGQRLAYQIQGPTQMLLTAPNGQTIPAQVVVIDQNTIQSTVGAQTSRSTRCPQGAGAAGLPVAR